MVRVLTVTNMYPRPEWPGFGTFVRVQVESLRAAGVTMDVVHIATRRSRLNYLLGIRQVGRALDAQHFDLIHVHFGLCGLTTAWQRRCPVVISYCGSDIMHPLNLRLSRWVARRAATIIVKSERLKRVLGDARAHVIPNGVDLSLFRPMDRQEARIRLGLDSQPRYVLFVGDYVGKLKRFDLVVAAVEQVRQSWPDSRVEIVPVYGEPFERVPLYMNAPDVLVLASEWEGSPNVVKEALACNLPVVAVDVGDVPQLLAGLAGCRIVERNAEGLARGLIEVLSNGRPSDSRARCKVCQRRLSRAASCRSMKKF